MKLKLARLIPSTALLCLLFASCKKEDAVNSPSTASPQNARVISMIGAMDDASDIEASNLDADEAVSTTGKGADACPVITYSAPKGVYPRTTTYDYGSGCTDINGNTISGKRYTTVKANYKTAPAGTIISVMTYSNYYVNGVNVAGNQTNKIAVAGSPGPIAIQSIFQKTVSDGTGNTSTYIGRLTRTQISGDLNSAATDKDWSIQQKAYGIELTPGEAPNVWQISTDGPSTRPIKKGSCAFRSSGQQKIILKSLTTTTNVILDYGTGDCDNAASITVNGGSPQSITLPFVFFTHHL